MNKFLYTAIEDFAVKQVHFLFPKVTLNVLLLVISISKLTSIVMDRVV